MGDFFNAEYWTAISTAVEYGGMVLVGMLIAASLFTVISGGPAARNWKKTEGH